MNQNLSSNFITLKKKSGNKKKFKLSHSSAELKCSIPKMWACLGLGMSIVSS